jgi:hypothetical protein
LLCTHTSVDTRYLADRGNRTAIGGYSGHQRPVDTRIDERSREVEFDRRVEARVAGQEQLPPKSGFGFDGAT